jgi:hypothetical protein
MTGAASPSFDQRPGELEATRGLATAPPLVLGHRVLEGWHVALVRDGVFLASLTIEQARALAAEIYEHSLLLEHGFEPEGGADELASYDVGPAHVMVESAAAAGEMPPIGSHEGALDRAMLFSQEGPLRPGRGGRHEGGRPDDPEPCPC